MISCRFAALRCRDVAAFATLRLRWRHLLFRRASDTRRHGSLAATFDAIA